MSSPLREVLLDYAPPLSWPALRRVLTWASSTELLATIQVTVGNPDDIGEHLPRAILTPYPLFAAHQFAAANNQGEVVQQLIIDLLGGDLVPEDEANAEVYYQDCLATRTVLKLLLQNEAPNSSSMLEQLLTFLNSNQAASLPEHHRTRCFGLASGARIPGVPTHIRATPYTSSHTRRIRFPNNERRSSSSGWRGGGQEDSVEPADPPSPYDLPGPDYGKAVSTAASGSSDEESSDPDAPPYYRRRRADFRSPGDDRRILSTLTWLQTTRDVYTEADIHRLPTGHLIEAIGMLSRREPIAWAYAWLLATTGVSVQRLQQTEVAHSATMSAHADSTCTINLDTGIFEIPLKGGPSGPIEAPNRRVRLLLPGAIVRTLIADEEHFPFKRTPSKADPALRRQFQRYTGITPTVQRLRATGEARIHGHAFDSTAAHALKGSFSHSAGGAAAYRRIDDQEMQGLFAAAAATLRTDACDTGISDFDAFPCAPEKTESAASPCRSETAPPRYVGSAKAELPSFFVSVFAELGTEITRLVESNLAEKGQSGGVQPATLVKLQNTHACYAYLALLVSTGMRPIGKHTTVQLSQPYWFIQDKDTPEFSERRYVPALQEVSDQISGQRGFTESLAADFRNVLRLRIHRPADRYDVSGPLWLEPNPKRLRVRKMLDSDFRTVIEHPGLNPRTPRHTLVTALRSTMPQSELNAMLGHSGGGWQRESPASLSTLQYSPQTFEDIRKLVNEAGFEPLHIWGRYVL